MTASLRLATVIALITTATTATAAAPDPPSEVEFGMPAYMLGQAGGQCRPEESGPAVLINVSGLKDRSGRLRAELYPANDSDFLQDDKILVRAGKTFHRVERTLPPSGPVQLCIRVPGPGPFTLALLHDRDMNRKFGFSSDGFGFPGNPVLRLGRPKAASATFVAGKGITEINIRMNYRRGLLSFGPLKG
jgi:uncharacterized protein (DUF2141 family)